MMPDGRGSRSSSSRRTAELRLCDVETVLTLRGGLEHPVHDEEHEEDTDSQGDRART